MATMVVIGLGMGSCADNIDNSTTPSQKEQQAEKAQQEKAQKFWAVVSQLVDVDDYTDDYEDKTFEPTYGIAQGTDGTRYVYTNTAAAAAARFADLVERDDIDENTQTYTYDDPDVGTFVYTKGSGRTLATVEVRVKQIPNLKKIIYVPGAYANGNFQGRAYYRFGDVVTRKVGNNTEYWICVRPSFGMEGKGDSHWVCLNSLPEKNVKHYHSDSKNKDYWLPTGLGTNKEHMQNLAEMLYAIYDSEQWEANVSDIANTDLVMFHDFDKTNYEFHNQYFWKNVRNAWKKYGILENALDYTLGEEAFTTMLQNEGLHLLYYGYSWWFKTSWDCTLYDAWYKNGTANKEKNMHLEKCKSIEKNMQDITFDCRQMGQRNINNYNGFFSDNQPNQPRLVVRHATGKELSSDGQYNVKGAIHGVTNLYRYYEYVNPTDDYTQNPEKTNFDESNYVSNGPKNGRGVYMLGDVVKDEYDNRWFCITGSPWLEAWPTVTDRAAWFVTFDFNEVATTGDTVHGLPTEEELPELVYRLALFYMHIGAKYTPPIVSFDTDPNGPLGDIAQHVKDYAGVDWHHLTVPRDSTWTFTSKDKTFDSKSTSKAFCLAYQDGSGKQAIARIIIDLTQGGDNRLACSAYDKDGNYLGKLDTWQFKIYKHYEKPEPMRQATAVEAALGMNTWCLPWAMTTQKMYLTDVTDAELVSRHAKNDKWVTLPIYKTVQRRQPRTQVEQSSKPSDYIGHYDVPVADQKLNMFNEPVLFLRVMKVDDKIGPYANLYSQDNRHLSIVHMLNLELLYKGRTQVQWVENYVQGRTSALSVDNVITICPPIAGWQIDI